jgi:hypothetical protein
VGGRRVIKEKCFKIFFAQGLGQDPDKKANLTIYPKYDDYKGKLSKEVDQVYSKAHDYRGLRNYTCHGGEGMI